MSRRFWIVCLLLVLVPLRGWAAASMGVPELPDHAAHDTLAMLCHEVPADGTADGPAEEKAAGGHACHLCDLCHSAVADQAEATLPPLPLPDTAPRSAASRDTGRHAVCGLDRPPRLPLA